MAIAEPIGRIEDLPPLEGKLKRNDSRAARILSGCLEEILPQVQRATARFGTARVAVVLGSSTGGFERGEQAHAYLSEHGKLPENYDFDQCQSFHSLIQVIQCQAGVSGPAFAVSTACSSSAKALASSQRLLQAGFADAVICGGADGLCDMTLLGFSSLRIYSPTGCSPFSPHRDGMSIGEGGALFLLERDGDAPVYLRGAGESHDSHHPTAPHPEGEGAARAMQDALLHAGLSPKDIGYINAHGTGTEKNDATEAKAIVRVFGTEVPVSSTKDKTGHVLGGAGAVEGWITAEVLSSGSLVPNRYGEAAGADEPSLAKAGTPETPHALSNSMAFGGNNASVVLSREPSNVSTTRQPGTVWITAAGAWSSAFESLSACHQGALGKDGTPPASKFLGSRARGRASLILKIHAAMLESLDREDGAPLSDVPWIFASHVGAAKVTVQLTTQALKRELSPALFQSSVHNASTGALSIALGHKGFATAIGAGAATTAMALLEAEALIRCQGGEALVVFADEADPAPLSRTRYPALGVGLRLELSEQKPTFALCRLGTPVKGRRPNARAETLYPDERSDLLKNPVAPALALALCTLSKTPRELDLGDGWSVQVSEQ